jgi:hypothetical protein
MVIPTTTMFFIMVTNDFVSCTLKSSIQILCSFFSCGQIVPGLNFCPSVTHLRHIHMSQVPNLDLLFRSKIIWLTTVDYILIVRLTQMRVPLWNVNWHMGISAITSLKWRWWDTLVSYSRSYMLGFFRFAGCVHFHKILLYNSRPTSFPQVPLLLTLHKL